MLISQIRLFFLLVSSQTNFTDFSEVAMDLHIQSCQQIFGCWFCSPGTAGDYSLQKEQWIILGQMRACHGGGGGNATWEEFWESKPLKIFPGRIPSNFFKLEGGGNCVWGEVGRRAVQGQRWSLHKNLTCQRFWQNWSVFQTTFEAVSGDTVYGWQ